MFGNNAPFKLLKQVLDNEDIRFLKNACRTKLETARIPCFSLIDQLESPTVQKIRATIESQVEEPLYYLNDFYIYTDSSFKTDWHMDTELFSFDRAVNAWILLSPEDVNDPLGFIAEINETPEHYYHSAKLESDSLVFTEYHTRRQHTKALAEIESSQVHTPKVDRGDILLIDPGRFHKTNVSSPKHAIAIKYVFKGSNGFLSPKQVHPLLWPEVKLFNRLVKDAIDWDEVVQRIRVALKTEEGQKQLSSGFYPDQFGMYLQRVRSI